MTCCVDACGCPVPVTAANVDMVVADNATWQDAFQFSSPDGTEWDFVGENFIMEIKASADDALPLFSLSTANGRIVVIDVAQRILKFNVPAATLTGALKPETYVYDLIMFDNSSPAVRTPLMYGKVTVQHGVTQD